MNEFYAANFYQFTVLQNLEQVKSDLRTMLQNSLGLSGLVIIAGEGINGTVASTDQKRLTEACSWLKLKFQIEDSQFKFSFSPRPLFSNFKVKIRPEIVTLQTPDLIPDKGQDETKLSPEEWNQWLKSEKKFHLIDSRNRYEYKIGTFKNALNPQIDQFTEFPDAVEHQMKIPKDETILTFCTGGIRCEKAVLELKRRGYQKVYQLQGGILSYLKDHPRDQFVGECFVFDHRVAVDQNLAPSKKFGFCPHCGDGAAEDIVCVMCESSARICDQCLNQLGAICSKNCAHHRSQGKTKVRPSPIRTHHARVRLI